MIIRMSLMYIHLIADNLSILNRQSIKSIKNFLKYKEYKNFTSFFPKSDLYIQKTLCKCSYAQGLVLL